MDRDSIYIGHKAIIAKLNGTNNKIFYILIPPNNNDDLLKVYHDNAEIIKSGNVTELGKLGELFTINDQKTVESINDASRLLPPGFSSLLELHKEYANILAEIKALQKLKPEDLLNLRSLLLH
jgi:hypothetical protein